MPAVGGTVYNSARWRVDWRISQKCASTSGGRVWLADSVCSISIVLEAGWSSGTEELEVEGTEVSEAGGRGVVPLEAVGVMEFAEFTSDMTVATISSSVA